VELSRELCDEISQSSTPPASGAQLNRKRCRLLACNLVRDMLYERETDKDSWRFRSRAHSRSQLRWMSLSKTYSRKIHNARRDRRLPLVNPGVHGHDSTLLRYVPVDIDPAEGAGFVSFPSCTCPYVIRTLTRSRLPLYQKLLPSYSANQLACLSACLPACLPAFSPGPPTSVFGRFGASDQKAPNCFHTNHHRSQFNFCRVKAANME